MAKKERSSGQKKKMQKKATGLAKNCRYMPFHPIKAVAPSPERPVLGADPTD